MTVPFGDGNEQLAALFENIGRMLRGSGGSVDWTAARESAVAAVETVAAITDADSAEVRAAADLADLWLDQATDLATSAPCSALNRRQWLDVTFDHWRTVVEPVADGMAGAMSHLITDAPRELSGEMFKGLPQEIREQMQAAMHGTDLNALSQSLGAIARTMGATMFGIQFGQALAEMSDEVLSSSDVGVVLPIDAVVLPHNVRSFAKGLGIDAAEALLYIVIRELAFRRLTWATPWLATRMADALAEFARGVRIDTSRIQSVMDNIDPNNPHSLHELLGGNLFDTAVSDAQQAARARLELLLALVEGWVTTVATIAIDRRLASASALEESLRRRRAAGGPAEKLLGGLVGLEPRPRLVREAVVLWQHITDQWGAAQRDALWQHPDLMPTADDLADPLAFHLPDEGDWVPDLGSSS